MVSSSFQKFDPARLAKLLDLDTHVEPVGGKDDFSAILAHQLNSALVDELDPSNPGRVRELASAATPPVVTFGDLLNHPHPPADLLRLVKNFARKSGERSGGHLPHDVVSALYFGSIAVAIARANVRISELDLPAIQKGVAWADNSPWIQQTMPGFFKSLAASLREEPAIMTFPKL